MTKVLFIGRVHLLYHRVRQRGVRVQCPECGADSFVVSSPRSVTVAIRYYRCGACRYSFKLNNKPQ